MDIKWAAVSFENYRSSVLPSFWQEFLDIKLNQERADMEVTRRIWGYYNFSSDPGTLILDNTAFNEYYEYRPGRQHIEGYHINYNTFEAFQQQDTSFILNVYGDALMEDICNRAAVDEPYRLIPFVLTSYTDVVHSNFYYRFAYPSVSHGDYIHFFTPSPVEKLFSTQQMQSLTIEHSKLESAQRCFFFFKIESAYRVSLVTLKDFIDNKHLRGLFRDMEDCLFLTYLDFTSTLESAGWLLRNVLFLLKYHCPELAFRPLRVISLRGEEPNEWPRNSVLFNVRQKAESQETMERARSGQEDTSLDFRRYIGWELDEEGENTYQHANLGNSCDSSRIDEEDAELNLKLANWTLDPLPNFDFVKKARYLILGAGAIGCSIAHDLMEWGALEITFVDDGIVSCTHPVRQYLFSQDAKQHTHKAIAAASALKLINSCMKSHGEVLRIPVPGRDKFIIDDVLKLESIICNHDVVFLATDTVKSLWLPTVICALGCKLAVAVSVNYNSFYIIRHGTPLDYNNPMFKLGCYFCKKHFPLTEDLNGETENKRSTMIRPGLRNLASGVAVELALAVMQNQESGSFQDKISEHIPHTIKGHFGFFNDTSVASPANDKCVACSNAVLAEYTHTRIEFLQNVFGDVKYLEKFSV